MDEIPQRFPLIAGLGNPGKTYRGTRHNFGYEVLDLLAKQDGVTWKKARFAQAETCRLASGSWLVKPRTYMNLSGDALKQSLNWFRIGPEQLLVVVDDVHLELGQLRLRPGGSAGGHNGLKSIETQLGTQDYARLRGGVGTPGHPDALKRHVLGKFDREEEKIIADAMKRAADGIRTACRAGLDIAMNELNIKK
ncbi:MAG: aminoacyl-tRNA hydrolase [Verrucomicrobiota bacterium]